MARAGCTGLAGDPERLGQRSAIARAARPADLGGVGPRLPRRREPDPAGRAASLGDDFQRAPGQLGGWTPLRGEWRIAEYRDPLVARYRLPAQASWLRGEPDGGPALATIGQDFWSDYAVSAHVRSDSGRAGLAFGVRGERFGLLRLRGDQAELTVTSGGREALLASLPLDGPPGTWHELRVELSRGTILASVDGGEPVEAAAPHLLDGAVGAWCDAPADFDDLAVEPATIETAKTPSRADELLGLTFDAGRATALVRPPETGEAGLALVGTDQAALALTLRSDRAGVRWRLTRGAEELAAGTVAAASTLALIRRGPAVEAEVQGQRVALWYGLTGQTGVRLIGPSHLREVMVRAVETDRPALVYRTEFDALTEPGKQKDEVWRVLGDILVPADRGWRVPRPDGDDGGQLVGDADRGPTSLWFRETVPGDAELRVELNALDRDATLTLRLARDAGYGLRLRGSQAELLRGEEVVARAALTAGAQSARLWRESGWVAADVDGQPLLWRDPQPLPGGAPGLELSGGDAAVDALTIGCRNAFASTFGVIDTDWREVGPWLWNTGMACIAWSHWVTGDGRAAPALLWRREPLPGDVTVRFHVSETTEGYDDERRAETHRHFPYHDVSLVLDGDGRDLDSGYRILIGANGGHGVRLLRRGQPVAENRSFTMRMGEHCNEPRSLHVDCDRRGGRLTLRLNERPMLEWTDPEPLAGGGRIALAVAGCRANFSDLVAMQVNSGY